MNAFIDFIMGPMVWISMFVFFGGSAYRIYKIYDQVKKKESFIFSFFSLKYGFRSIFAWLMGRIRLARARPSQVPNLNGGRCGLIKTGSLKPACSA